MPLVFPLLLILKTLVCSNLLDVIVGRACSWNRFKALINHRQRGPFNGALSQERGGRLITHLLKDVYLFLFVTFWAVPIEWRAPTTPLTTCEAHSVSEYSD
jgi:hypothetical protein